MEVEKTDKFARIIAIISLVVAIAAVAIPYLEQRRQFSVLQQEELAVRLNPQTDGPIRITDQKFGPMGRLIQVPWRLTFSNNGNRKLSIARYSITSGATPNAIVYTGIDGGTFEPDLKPIDLPLTLDAGDTRSYQLFVGVLVPAEVHEVLSSLKEPGLRTVANAREALGKAGIDFYGNKVSYRELAPGSSVLTVDPENQKSPIFWYQAITSRGNVFLTSGTTYEGPR